METTTPTTIPNYPELLDTISAKKKVKFVTLKKLARDFNFIVDKVENNGAQFIVIKKSSGEHICSNVNYKYCALEMVKAAQKEDLKLEQPKISEHKLSLFDNTIPILNLNEFEQKRRILENSINELLINFRKTLPSGVSLDINVLHNVVKISGRIDITNR